MDVSDQTTTEDRPMSDVEDNTILPVTDYETMANKIMPDLGYEIEDFKYNTWHVTNWRNLEKRITGPEFEAGNWKWRILLFPFGNNNQEVVSIYLDSVDPKGAPASWHSCVQFALVLWSPEDPTQYIYHHAHHRFTAEESDWGFNQFYDLPKLLTPCENRTRALIENDSTNITVFVRVLKDPTGVLWHNFINYDSKEKTGYVGLKKQGATSYMNSLLQSLYCTTYFRKAVYQIPTKDDEPIESVSLALQRVFYQLQISNTPVETTELTKSFGWDSTESFVQHDVQEFNRVLQNNLEDKIKNTKADGAITKLFVGKMKNYIKCNNVDYETSYVEDYYDIQLNVKGCKTLRDSFKDYIQEETLEGNNKYQAEGYGLQDAKKGVIFESFPPVLHLQLKRFEYDLQRDTMVKNNDRHEFPMEIDLEEFLSEDADRSSPHKYLLHGVLVHCGDSHEGHYFALLKPEKDGKWFKFHDERITRIVDKEVLEDNYGDEYPNANIIKIRSTKIHDRFTNAYMLVYIRESNVDEILSPVVPEDIPEHLQKRLEQERAIEEEERHLYLIVKIVTAEKFKVHQGFDLANFDDRQYPLSDVFTYKILKHDTYGSFKEHVSRSFNIPTERVRFWVFVNRENKTVRLDAPISDSLINTSMEEIHIKMTSRQNEMELYMEVADKPINGKIWFPIVPEANHIMIFLKYFDPNKQALEGLGHLYVQKFGKVGDITRDLCEKKEFPPDTPLKIYEEVKPNMIIEMILKSTFQQSEIQDGDIICFQKALTENEIQKHTKAGHCWDIPHFYESLTLRIVVSFKPKFDYFCTVKVVTAEKFKNHQGFDLVDFNISCQDTLSGVYLYKIPKRETYGVFKENISRRFNVPPEQVQFWVLIDRQNKTIRAHIPMTESFFKTNMEKICRNMNSQQNELKLYMEIADKPINGNTWFPIIKENNRNGSSIIIFLKYFDPSTQTLKGLCHLYVQKFGKVKDYIDIFREKKKLAPNTPLKIYEEIGLNVIKEMGLDSIFQQRNGDIICFQKDLTEKEIREYIKAGHIYSIPQFYESLTQLKVKDKNPKSKFDLVLNKKWTYDQVAGAVATYLNMDPLKLQFTTVDSTSGTPKDVIKRNTKTLSEMLQTAYLSTPVRILFYEILDENVKQKTRKFSRFFKIIWLGNTIKKTEFISIYLQKNATVNEIIKEICKKVTLSSPNAKIRLYEVINHKIQKEYKGIEPINEIQEFMTLYAEEISQEELLNKNILQVYHFTKDPLSTHGTPFKFFIKNDEVFADTKIRLQLRLGMNKEEFAKIRIAIVSDVVYKKPEYLDDDDIILSKKKLSNMDYLGLDHIDETGQAKSADRTIYIRG